MMSRWLNFYDESDGPYSVYIRTKEEMEAAIAIGRDRYDRVVIDDGYNVLYDGSVDDFFV